MLHLFSGKPIPDNRENITLRLDDHIQSVQGKEDYEDEMFSIRYFKKGSAHITFRKPELVDRLNDIIARHYPEAPGKHSEQKQQGIKEVFYNSRILTIIN